MRNRLKRPTLAQVRFRGINIRRAGLNRPGRVLSW